MNDDERAALLARLRRQMPEPMTSNEQRAFERGVMAGVDAVTPVMGPAGKLLGFVCEPPRRTVEILAIDGVTEYEPPGSEADAVAIVRGTAPNLTDEEARMVGAAWWSRICPASRAGLAAAIREVLPDVEVKP